MFFYGTDSSDCEKHIPVTAAGQGAENGPQCRHDILEQKYIFYLKQDSQATGSNEHEQISIGGKLRSLARHWGTKAQGNRKLAVAMTKKMSNRKSKNMREKSNLPALVGIPKFLFDCYWIIAYL